jgi:DNA-binding CsgD family transcriptional regulator
MDDHRATDSWPLTGRETELDAINRAIAAGNPGGFILYGATGVGKTRMAREALALARSAKRETEWVAASRAAASIPFGAVSRLLSPDIPARADSLEILRRSTEHVLRRAGSMPVVLSVDDAHLIDDRSATLIYELMLRGAVFLLATVHTAEPVPDAIMALWKDGHAKRLDLRPLSAAAVDDLLDRVLGPRIDGVSRQEIHRVTEGNAQLIHELLTAALDDAALIQSEGVWRWASGPRYGISLVELVEAQLPRPGQAVRTILEILALAGHLPVDVIDRLVIGGMLEPDAVAAAETSGFVAHVQVGRREALRLAQPIHGEIIRGSLPRSRAGQLWRWLVAAAKGFPQRRNDDILRVATWHMRAGAVQRPSEFLAAAGAAVRHANLSLAEQLVRAAQRGSSGLEADHALARVLTWQGRHREAAAALPDTPPGSGDARTEWAVTHAWNLYWGHGRIPDAEEELDEIIADDEEARGYACGARAWLFLSRGQPRRALDAVGTIGARQDSATEWPFPLVAMAFAAALSGWPGPALTIVERHDSQSAPAGPPDWGSVLLGWARCLAMILAGRARQAQSLAEQGYAAAVGRMDPGMAAGWATYLGLAALALGRVTTADMRLREALASLGDHDPYQLARYVLAELAAAAALKADGRAAAEWMRRSDARNGDLNKMFEPRIEQNRAWVLAANGELTAAARQARCAADLARSGGQHAVEAAALYDAARLGKPRWVLPRLTELGRMMGGDLIPLLAATAAALAAADGKELDGSATALDALGLPLFAAEAAVAAARAYRQSGRRAAASACTERARSLAAASEGARTPLLGSDDAASMLTHRQREISMLAASGMSSKTIADRLLISTRTVNNHLACVYDRLGVSSRAQLAGIMSGQPLQM